MKTFRVNCSLDDTGTPSAPHAYCPVTLSFDVQADTFEDAVRESKLALKECSKLQGAIDKVEER
jgi:hypothetical protein